MNEETKKIVFIYVGKYMMGGDNENHLEYEPTPEELTEMKLTPYKGLSSETIIRYLYTGREYNIETGDYYYRYRMMEAGIGRFTGKDSVKYPNGFIYTINNPVIFYDKNGKDYEFNLDFTYWQTYFWYSQSMVNPLYSTPIIQMEMTIAFPIVMHYLGKTVNITQFTLLMQLESFPALWFSYLVGTWLGSAIFATYYSVTIHETAFESYIELQRIPLADRIQGQYGGYYDEYKNSPAYLNLLPLEYLPNK